jgi:hypothetical protein
MIRIGHYTWKLSAWSKKINELTATYAFEFFLYEKQMKRNKRSPIAGTSTSTHTFHFLPDYVDKNHY